MNKRWIQLGIVGKAHGLHGAFFISNRESLLPESVKAVRVGKDPEKSQLMTVKACRWQAERPLLQLEQVKAREVAELMVHSPIWAERSQIEIDDDKEYFWGDLLGKKVVDTAGKTLGLVKDVQNYGASDIIFITAADGRSLEIPFVPTYFDMKFSYSDPELKMTVTADTFDDAWNPA